MRAARFFLYSIRLEKAFINITNGKNMNMEQKIFSGDRRALLFLFVPLDFSASEVGSEQPLKEDNAGLYCYANEIPRF